MQKNNEQTNCREKNICSPSTETKVLLLFHKVACITLTKSNDQFLLYISKFSQERKNNWGRIRTISKKNPPCLAPERQASCILLYSLCQRKKNWACKMAKPQMSESQSKQMDNFTKSLLLWSTRNRRSKLSCILFFWPMRRKKHEQDQKEATAACYWCDIFTVKVPRPRSNKPAVKVK